MNKQEAYEIVYKDLVSKNNSGLFRGKYDARNGSRDFMFGIQTVIENIAFHVGEPVSNSFSDMFTHNMVLSEEKAEREKRQKSLVYKILSKIHEFRWDK